MNYNVKIDSRIETFIKNIFSVYNYNYKEKIGYIINKLDNKFNENISFEDKLFYFYNISKYSTKLINKIPKKDINLIEDFTFFISFFQYRIFKKTKIRNDYKLPKKLSHLEGILNTYKFINKLERKKNNFDKDLIDRKQEEIKGDYAFNFLRYQNNDYLFHNITIDGDYAFNNINIGNDSFYNITIKGNYAFNGQNSFGERSLFYIIVGNYSFNGLINFKNESMKQVTTGDNSFNGIFKIGNENFKILRVGNNSFNGIFETKDHCFLDIKSGKFSFNGIFKTGNKSFIKIKTLDNSFNGNINSKENSLVIIETLDNSFNGFYSLDKGSFSSIKVGKNSLNCNLKFKDLNLNDPFFEELKDIDYKEKPKNIKIKLHISKNELN